MIGIARTEHASFAADGHLQLPAQDDSALLGVMMQQILTGVGARRIVFMQDLQAAVGETVADLPVTYFPTADLNQLRSRKKDLLVQITLAREEVGERERNPGKNFLQQSYGRIRLVLLDQGNDSVQTPARCANARCDSPRDLLKALRRLPISKPESSW